MAEQRTHGRLRREAVRLARNVPTPFYLFDSRLAASNARRWSRIAGLSGAFETFYPYKCNRHPSLLTVFAREGLGAEVGSLSDLAAAEALGISGSRIVVQGPAKDRSLLDRALAAGAFLVADGPEDAEAILARAKALGVAPRSLLRLRASAAEASQRSFGLPPGELVRLARRFVRAGAPAPEGLAFHLGTGISSTTPYVAAIRQAGAVARSLRENGTEVRLLDLGGGFPASGESRRDGRGRPRRPAAPPETFLRKLSAELRSAIPGARAFLEPGRALASDAFGLVTRVLRVSGKRVFVDGSRMSHALFVPRGKHPFLPIPLRAGRGPRLQVAGPLPLDLEVLSAAESVGRPREGDLLVIACVGAYNVIASNSWAGEARVVEMETGG